jgi:hypothetical protein
MVSKRKCCKRFCDKQSLLYYNKESGGEMRTAVDCVTAFFTLLSTEYELILGRKGVSVTLRLTFDKKDCFHLMGLQYLRDRPELNRDRGKVFDEIMNGTIKLEQIQTSDFYGKIEKRIHFLPLLENMIDDNRTIFKYNQKANLYSVIEADYLMENSMELQNLFLFLSREEGNRYFCRSFFPEEKMDYTKNQASWTLLYKKKIDRLTGKERILYNKMKD